MTLKIVSGTAKGRKLKGPKGKGIRPAASRVRKSIFDILGNLSGKNVLDLFAGTGSVGLEALSRGATQATFVDSEQAAVSLLFANLETLGFLGQAHILKKPAELAIEFLDRKKLKYDVIFLDPPYDKGHLNRCLRKLAKSHLLVKDGLLVCEHSPREIPQIFDGLQAIETRKYGQTLITLMKPD